MKSRLIKVGGGGSEKYMILVPLGIGFFASVYALGGPGQTLNVLEHWAQAALEFGRNLLR
jgi:DMSO reductase anchor subunit